MNIVQKRKRVVKGGRHRAPRPKTFKTEEAAKAYAKENGITSFTLENMKCSAASSKKIRIAQKN
jgi:hypothetical protein